MSNYNKKEKMELFMNIGKLQQLQDDLDSYKNRDDIRSIDDIPNKKDRARAKKIIKIVSEIGDELDEKMPDNLSAETAEFLSDIISKQAKMPYMEAELQPEKLDFYNGIRCTMQWTRRAATPEVNNKNLITFTDIHSIHGGKPWTDIKGYLPNFVVDQTVITPSTALYAAEKLNINPENIMLERVTKEDGGHYLVPSAEKIAELDDEPMLNYGYYNVCLQRIKEGKATHMNLISNTKKTEMMHFQKIAKDKELSSKYLQAIADTCDKYATKKSTLAFYKLMDLTSHIAKENPEQIDKVTEIIDKSFNEVKKGLKHHFNDGQYEGWAIEEITESMIEIAENKNLSDEIRQKAQKNAIKTLDTYAYMDIEHYDLDSIQKSCKQLSEKILKSPVFSEEYKKFVTKNMEKVNTETAKLDNVDLMKSGDYYVCMDRIKDGKATTPNLGYGANDAAEKIAKDDILSSEYIQTVADNCDKYLDTYEHSLVFENMVNLSAQIAKENPNQVKNLAKVLDKTNSLVTKIKPETEKPYQYAVTTIADTMVKVAENKELPETTRQDAQKNAVSAMRNISNIYGLSDRREYKELTNKILQSPNFSDENKHLVANAYKNSGHDKDFVKEFVANKKKEIQKRLAERRENTSGVVAADKIAEAKRNGSLKDTITPEKGKLLASFINSQANQK